MIEVKNNKHSFLKWIYLALAILLNGFIIMHACLPATVSSRWSNAFVSFFMHIFNSGAKDTTHIVHVNDLEFVLDDSYSYNNIVGYQKDEIVIGKNKKYQVNILPTNTTNKALKFVVDHPDVVSIRQQQNYLYVTALKVGEAKIEVISEDNLSTKKEIHVRGVEKIAPPDFEIEENIYAYDGAIFDLGIKVNNGSFYDYQKLDYQISDPSLFSSYSGDYYLASKVGETLIKINDKQTTLHILDNKDVIAPTFTSLEGTDSLTSGASYRYSVNISNEPTSKDVYWSISNSSFASINQDGTLNVKEIKEETKLILTASSKIKPDVKINKEIILKPVVIKDFELVLDYIGSHVNDMPMMGETGQTIKIWYEDSSGTIRSSGLSVTSSNPEVANAYLQGDYIYIQCMKEGTTTITATSINNPLISHYIDLEVSVKGVINYENYQSFSEFIRKSIGHFLLFLVSGVFTFLFFYELLKDKKIYFSILFASIVGLVVAIISEVIQHFIPTRFGSVIDVITDFGGYMLGLLLVFGIIILISRHQKRKKQKIEEKNI